MDSRTMIPFLLLLLLASLAAAQLSPFFYNEVCPGALPAIKRIVNDAVAEEPRMGASLLRLHFHDCFVNGCDGSVLLDPTSTIDSEKNALPNVNSIRGFEVIDRIKAEVDRICGCPVVSCADILAVAARDSVVSLGGPTWSVQLGRRDSTTASRTAANSDLPAPFQDLPQLINNFKKKGLNERDLVVLSGAHTLGFAHCRSFKNRIQNDTNIDPKFALELRKSCPLSGGDSNLSPLSPNPASFDVDYFTDLLKQKGLMHSDQALFSGGSTDGLVKLYGCNSRAFFGDFASSMIKMGNISPLTGKQGQIRRNCRRVNK